MMLEEKLFWLKEGISWKELERLVGNCEDLIYNNLQTMNLLQLDCSLLLVYWENKISHTWKLLDMCQP